MEFSGKIRRNDPVLGFKKGTVLVRGEDDQFFDYCYVGTSEFELFSEAELVLKCQKLKDSFFKKLLWNQLVCVDRLGEEILQYKSGIFYLKGERIATKLNPQVGRLQLRNSGYELNIDVVKNIYEFSCSSEYLLGVIGMGIIGSSELDFESS